jgi:hypothetical protein
MLLIFCRFWGFVERGFGKVLYWVLESDRVGRRVRFGGGYWGVETKAVEGEDSCFMDIDG